MSYDIYLKADVCPTCGNSGPEPQKRDPTYNLTPIFDAALTGASLPNPDVSEAEVVLFHKGTDRPRGLRLLDGMKARETVTILEAALARLRDPAREESFRALEPPNKWGDLEGAVWVLEHMLDDAREYPNNTWSIR